MVTAGRTPSGVADRAVGTGDASTPAGNGAASRGVALFGAYPRGIAVFAGIGACARGVAGIGACVCGVAVLAGIGAYARGIAVFAAYAGLREGSIDATTGDRIEPIGRVCTGSGEPRRWLGAALPWTSCGYAAMAGIGIGATFDP